MVRTMESNKYFVGKDRVYLGSLLMVVLQVRQDKYIYTVDKNKVCLIWHQFQGVGKLGNSFNMFQKSSFKIGNEQTSKILGFLFR